jgi:hypothetical protein
MELILIEPQSPEWNFMWNWLAKHPLNKDIPEPTVALNGEESWQYMGSFKQGDRVIHELRHRNHPTTNSIQSLKLEASPDFTKEQINKSFRL